MSRHRHPRSRRSRLARDLAALESAFAVVWAERHAHSGANGSAPAGSTPLGIAFATAWEWQRWVERTQAVCPGLDVLTVVPMDHHEHGVTVYFQRHDGQWLAAELIDQLRALAVAGDGHVA